jgi:hypothetical protein
MSDSSRFVDEPEEDDYARGLREEPAVTVEEELEREREGSFARGQEVLPEDTVEKDRTDSFARGQEELPEDTEEKVREGSFAEGQEELPHEPERVEPAFASEPAAESGPAGADNVPERDEPGLPPTS